MCAGAILNSRIARVVYGARDKRLGALGSTYDILDGNPINRVIAVEGPAMEEECLEMLKRFFREIRARKKSDSKVDLMSESGEFSGDSGDGTRIGLIGDDPLSN
jgi:tRNA(adenine34) deaminase